MKRRKKNKPPDVYASAPFAITELEDKISNFKKERLSMLKKGFSSLALIITYEIFVIEKELCGRKISKKFKDKRNVILSKIKEREKITDNLSEYNTYLYIRQYIRENDAFIRGLRFYL